MEGVKNLTRRPRKGTGTSRVSDRSLLERVELPQSGKSSKDSGRPKRSGELKSIRVLLAFMIVLSHPLKPLRL
jgi:hypothetical protein